MANNIFSKAKAYVKAHPRTSYQDAIKIVAKKKKAPAKKKPAAKKKVARKKAVVSGTKRTAAKKPVALKVKIKRTKRGGSVTIGAISITKVQQEHSHQAALMDALQRHRELLKDKGLTATEKAQIRRDIAKYQNNIKASKQHVSALKRSI